MLLADSEAIGTAVLLVTVPVAVAVQPLAFAMMAVYVPAALTTNWPVVLV